MPAHDLQRARAVEQAQHAVQRVRDDEHLDDVAPAGVQQPELVRARSSRRHPSAARARRPPRPAPARRGDVVHAKDARAALERGDRRAHASVTRAAGSRTPRQLSDESLARRADHHRIAPRREPLAGDASTRSECSLRFAKPIPGIDRDALARRSPARARSSTRSRSSSSTASIGSPSYSACA